ncbi:MAG: hypothetical protein U0941_18265 [Planctomycetaceae bacterium]
MAWYTALEEELLPVLRQAGDSVSRNVSFVELDYVNADIRVITTHRVDSQERARIEQAIREQLGQGGLNTDCPIHVTRPGQLSFTSHMTKRPHATRPLLANGNVMRFDIDVEQLLALREAEAQLRSEAERATVTVAFALGGTSTLVRLSQLEFEQRRPRDPREVPAFADEFVKRYHLFPGLGWDKQLEVPKLFGHWLESLPATDRVLIFDTGSKGNGPRAILNLLEEVIPQSQQVAINCISIVGIVDGTDSAQQEKDIELVTRTRHKVRVRIRYLRVPRVLSEDCEILLGYDRNRKLGYLLPLRDTAVFRLVDGEGRCLQIRGTDKASQTYQNLMTAALEQPSGNGQPLTSDVEKAIVASLIDVTTDIESHDLQGCYEMGLIGQADFKRECAAIKARSAAALARYPDAQWCFSSKEVVRKTSPRASAEAKG